MEGHGAFDREQAFADYIGFLLSEHKAGRIDPDDYYAKLLTALEAWDRHAANWQELTSFKTPE